MKHEKIKLHSADFWSRLWKLVLMVLMVSIVSVLVSHGLDGLGLSLDCLGLDFIHGLDFVAD